MKSAASHPVVPSSKKSAEELSAIVVDCAYKLHVEAGPGLLETVYEVVLAKMLEERGLRVRRQVPVPIALMGLKFDEGFRADLIIKDLLLIELKSVENLAPVHAKQVLTYFVTLYFERSGLSKDNLLFVSKYAVELPSKAELVEFLQTHRREITGTAALPSRKK